MQTDYFALALGLSMKRANEIHSSKPEPCQNVMDMGGSTGENSVVCGLDCWLFCEVCEVSACSRSCARELGCTHLERAA